MSRLIDIKHPFQIKNVSSINEYLFILKNILRILSQGKAYEKPKGFSIPVRWSSIYNDYAVDFGSNKNRDIMGVCLDNLSFYFNEQNELFNSIACLLEKLKNSDAAEALFEKYKLKKNENRFLNFIVDKEKIYVTGLYNRCQTSKRTGMYSKSGKKSVLIDNSECFLKILKESITSISILRSVNLINKYEAVFNNFLSVIEGKKILLKENNNIEKTILLNDYLNKKNKKLTINITEYYNVLNNKVSLEDANIVSFLIYYITLKFNKVVLESLNVENVESVIVFDNISKEFVKIVKEYNVIIEEKKENLLFKPILPVSF